MADTFFCLSCMTRLSEESEVCPNCGDKVWPENKDHHLSTGTILVGRYLVGRCLGEGGFGITYVGYDLKLEAKVAIKEYFLSGGVSRTKEETVTPVDSKTEAYFIRGRTKFLEEARVLAKFDNDENIVNVRDYYEENNTAYIVMEYLEGIDMNKWLKQNGPQSFETVYEMLCPVMRSLGRVHKEGLIHRDISPANLMLLSNGKVKLLDFGAAREQSIGGERSLSVMLKPGFAPEEQYRSHGEQGPWTDIYAICASIYKLITGKSPQPSIDRAFEDKLELPSQLGVQISPAQESVLLKGLAINASDRYKSTEKLCEDFEKNIVVKQKKSRKPRKKKKLGLVLTTVAAIAAAAVAAVMLLPRSADTIENNTETGDKANKTEEKYVKESRYIKVKECWYHDDGHLFEKIIYDDFNEYGTPAHHQTTYSYKPTQDKSGYPLSSEYNRLYDENGEYLGYENISFYADGTERYSKTEVVDNISYVYDREGNLTRWFESVEENGADTTYHYNADGTLNYLMLATVSETENGTERCMSQFDEYGDEYWRIIYKYDINGNMIYRWCGSPGNEQEMEETYTYDEEGRAVEVTYREVEYDGTVYKGYAVFEYELMDILVEKDEVRS